MTASEVTLSWACDIFRNGIQTQKEINEKKRKKKRVFSSKSYVFFRQQQSQNMKLFKYFSEKDKILDRIVIVKTETYL